MSSGEERQNGREWCGFSFEERFKETGNPLYVWQALDIAGLLLISRQAESKGQDVSTISLQTTVPDWCMRYLWSVAVQLSALASGRDPDAWADAFLAGGDTYERWLKGEQFDLETINRRAWKAFRLTRPGWSAFREYRSEQESAEARAAFDGARDMGRSVDEARIEAAAALGADDPYGYDERELRRRMNGRKRRRRKQGT